MVKAITVPEVVLELVSEFSSKEESCNNRENNFNNYHYHENYKKEISKSPSISELEDFIKTDILLLSKLQKCVKVYILKNSKLTVTIHQRSLVKIDGMIHRAEKESIATTFLSPSLSWLSLAPTIYDLLICTREERFSIVDDCF